MFEFNEHADWTGNVPPEDIEVNKRYFLKAEDLQKLEQLFASNFEIDDDGIFQKIKSQTIELKDIVDDTMSLVISMKGDQIVFRQKADKATAELYKDLINTPEIIYHSDEFLPTRDQDTDLWCWYNGSDFVINDVITYTLNGKSYSQLITVDDGEVSIEAGTYVFNEHGLQMIKLQDNDKILGNTQGFGYNDIYAILIEFRFNDISYYSTVILNSTSNVQQVIDGFLNGNYSMTIDDVKVVWKSGHMSDAYIPDLYQSKIFTILKVNTNDGSGSNAQYTYNDATEPYWAVNNCALTFDGVDYIDNWVGSESPAMMVGIFPINGSPVGLGGTNVIPYKFDRDNLSILLFKNVSGEALSNVVFNLTWLIESDKVEKMMNYFYLLSIAQGISYSRVYIVPDIYIFNSETNEYTFNEDALTIETGARATLNLK